MIGASFRNALAMDIRCLSEADLVRETAKKFGYTRAVGTTESVISYTLKKALTAGLIKKSESGNISAK